MNEHMNPAETTVETGNDAKAYRGLQKVVAGRDRQIADLTGQIEALQQQLNAMDNDEGYATWRQERQAAAQREAREAQYEALRAEFEQEDEPPTPLQHTETYARAAKTEPSVDDLRSDLDRQTGKSSKRPDWGDVIR